MHVQIELEKHDYDNLHDVILDATGRNLENKSILGLWKEIPMDIKGIAIEWGTSDTVFRDEFHSWITKLKDSGFKL